MTNDMTRRDFLEVTATTGALFLADALWPAGALAQSSSVVAIPEADRIVVTVITDNLADATRPNEKIARRPGGGKRPMDSAMHAEHGLSYHIEAVVDGKPHAFLFDFGTQAQGIKRNIDFLNLDFGKIEAMAISHDHWDHEAAFVELLKGRSTDLHKGLPLYLGEGFFVGTYGKRPSGDVQMLSVVSRDEIEAAGVVRIVEVKAPTAIVPGALLTGPVPQVTDYERIAPNFMAKKGDEFVQEQFIGEQSVVMNLRGKGLVVLTACSHRGVINIVKHAQRLTGIEKVHLVVGGFHLTGARPEVIARTVADMKAIQPTYIVPTHCTGFEAIGAFAREMPDQFILNTAGTRYFIES
jgi:7,8-dihydropterin-6-yl-methyl-4-(beta-D-ribofuranosyl)aminobenzene 5'-phosphate synthase